MSDVRVYDKMKWHVESVEEMGLDESNAAHHIAYFFRWLLDHQMTSDMLRQDFAQELAAYRNGSLSALDFLLICDGCLVSDMLSTEANAFAHDYYGPQRSVYLPDFDKCFGNRYANVYQVPWSEDIYREIGAVIDKRLEEWKRKQDRIPGKA